MPEVSLEVLRWAYAKAGMSTLPALVRVLCAPALGDAEYDEQMLAELKAALDKAEAAEKQP